MKRGARVTTLAQSRVARQAALFAATTGFVYAIAAASRAVLAANLDPAAFGSFSFAVAFVLFCALFFELGLFVPAARLVARTDQVRRASEIAGAALITFMPVGLAFCAAIFGASYVVDDIFNVDAGTALRVSAPLVFVYPLLDIGMQLSQGSDRLHVYSLAITVGQALYMAALVAIVATTAISASLAFAVRTAAAALSCALILVWLRPRLRGARAHVGELFRQARDWGFRAYTGRMLSNATYQSDILFVAAMATAGDVGLYALGSAFATAGGVPVTGIYNALFARMTRAREIARNWVVGSWVIGLASAAAVWLLAPPVIDAVFSSDYAGATKVILPLALAEAVRGVTSLYASFLTAQARGRELRNAALVLSVVSLILTPALIAAVGLEGAGWARLGAILANLAAHVWYYRAFAGRPAETA